jgi:lactate permease
MLLLTPGSANTVSNPIPSQYHHRVVQVVDVSGATMVAAQSVGAAADNMIAIHNVVAASARLGVMWRKGLVPRRTVIPTFFSWCWPAR